MRKARVTRESAPSAIRDVIRSDPYLRCVYRESYGRLLMAAHQAPHPELPVVEVGGAPAIVKDIDPTVIVTDVIEDPTVDLTCTAEPLPFADGSVRALIMKDVLHHVRDVRRYMAEASRVLAPHRIFSRPPVPACLPLALHALECRVPRLLRPLQLNIAFALWSPGAI